MFKPNDAGAMPSAPQRIRALALVILLAPPLAWPVVTIPEPAASAPGATPAAPKPAGDYQIRCWQYGRLLFEENHVALPDTAQYGLRVSGKDRNGQPLFVAETKNATCLIRPSVQERHWPR